MLRLRENVAAVITGLGVRMVDRSNVPDRTLFIGDNLEVLRGINSESVDLIYLNPPRNMGKIQKAPVKTRAYGVSYDDTWAAERVSPDLLAEMEVLNPEVTYAIDVARITHGESMGAYLVFMAARLLELKRIMKPAGSIYLQCDPRTAHLLRVIMDAVFGQENFKNEVVFERRAVAERGRRWMWAHDTLLFYTGPKMHLWNKQLTQHGDDHWERNYRYKDERGRYQLVPLTKQGRRYDDRGKLWGDYDPSRDDRFWSVPMRLVRLVEPGRDDLDDLSAQEKLDILLNHEMIHWPKRAPEPRYKLYEWAAENAPVGDVLTDIGRIEPGDVERTGWPGQVPVALLKMILRASTDEGDLVLDPFCGSGTACVAAEQLGRRWIGIEREAFAGEILPERLEGETELRHGVDVLRESPERTDCDERLHPGETWKTLYERQGGRCNGCEYELPRHLLSFDRIAPPAKPRGPDSPDNLQLLCAACRSIKGANDTNYLKVMLYESGILGGRRLRSP